MRLEKRVQAIEAQVLRCDRHGQPRLCPVCDVLNIAAVPPEVEAEYMRLSETLPGVRPL